MKTTMLVLALLLGTLVPVRVAAQEGADVPDSVTVEAKPSDIMRSRDLLILVTSEMDSLTALEKLAVKADDDALQLLRAKAERHIEAIDDNQPNLLKLVLGLDPDDPEAAAIRTETELFLEEKFNIYEEAIRWWAREIDDLRGSRSRVPDVDRAELESRINKARQRLDDLLPVLGKILEDGDSLGMDTKKVWKRYERVLNNRAENLIGRLQIAVDARNDLNKQIADKRNVSTAEDKINLDRAQLQIAETRLQGLAKSLEITVDLLGRRGFETAQYRQFIIKSTGQITERVLDPKVLLGLTKDFLEDVGVWIKDNGPTILVKFLIILASVFFFRITFRLAWWLLRVLGLIKLTRLMLQLGSSLLNPVATIIGLFSGLWLVGANPTTLLTGAGVAGVIIGFALQDSLSNLAAGFFILATRPFDVDDVIRTGTVVGTVRAMWIANTTVVTFDGRRLLIPNRKIWSDIIENRSVEPLRRVDIMVRVGYDEDIDRAIAILHDLVKNEGRTLHSPEPLIFVSQWAESWVDVAVRPWARNEDWWPLLTDLPRLAVQRFAAEGIEIPYPRREIAETGGAPAGPPESGPGAGGA